MFKTAYGILCCSLLVFSTRQLRAFTDMKTLNPASPLAKRPSVSAKFPIPMTFHSATSPILLHVISYVLTDLRLIRLPSQFQFLTISSADA